jgi:large subunit ribosomal protein L21
LQSNLLTKHFIMFAIVNIAGQQFKVEKGQELFVHRLEAEEGAKVTFDEVLLTDDKGNTQVGTPILDVKVTATVLSHLKGNKVIVFKKKRRKGYKVKNGHRQSLTQIKINKIA